MLHLDSRFVHLLSPRLERFKAKGSYLFCFKCPYCEAGTRDNKMRGYVYEREGRLNFYCHRCGKSMGLSRFLRDIDPGLYAEYVRERFEGARPTPAPLPRAEPPRRFFTAEGIFSLTSLPPEHIARRFAASRMIPDERAAELAYADDFYGWARKIVPDKYKGMRREARLVIPFLGADGTPTALQGRALGDSDARYVTVTVRPDRPMLYGLERLRGGEPVLALEGPIDAMFLSNAVASGGGDITRELGRAALSPEQVVVVYDCEKRHPATVAKMRRAAERGYGVCVWPDSTQHKDINDMVRAGISPRSVREVIDSSTYRGAAALAMIAAWNRC